MKILSVDVKRFQVLILILAICLSPLASVTALHADEDVTLPSDAETISLGKDRYGAKCAGFCHGSAGKGGRAPCLICGKFKRGGTNADLIKNITEGVKNSPMGAFGEVYSRDEIVAIVAYLRDEQKKAATE